MKVYGKLTLADVSIFSHPISLGFFSEIISTSFGKQWCKKISLVWNFQWADQTSTGFLVCGIFLF